ncbi:MAG: Hsp20/alpha crystallin family protein [Bacteroidetes bacterium]|nr:Hsp20/alpha crystallin family protein [Bacteroidota bacterium]
MSNKTLIRQSGFPTIFNDFFRPFFGDGEDAFNNLLPLKTVSIPSVNVVEKKNYYEISVAAPGLKKDDFQIDIQGDLLTISAEKETNKEEKEERFTRQEFNYTSFSRSFTLPDWVNKDKVEAGYENGLLTINLPKTEEKKQAATRQIAIK